MKTLAKFHKEHRVIADGVRALNALEPKTTITYLTYRSWVGNLKKPPISESYRTLLLAKGIKI